MATYWCAVVNYIFGLICIILSPVILLVYSFVVLYREVREWRREKKRDTASR